MRHHHLPARHAVIALAAGMLLFVGCAASRTADIPPAARPAALAAPTTFSVTVTTELIAPSTPAAQPKHLAYTGSGVIDTAAHTADPTVALPAGVQLELREVGDRLYLDQTPHGAAPGWLATPAPAAGQQPDPWQLATRCIPAPLPCLTGLGVAVDNLGTDQITNTAATHYRGTAAATTLLARLLPQQQPPAAAANQLVTIDLWTHPATGAARQLRLTTTGPPSQPTVATTLTLTTTGPPSQPTVATTLTLTPTSAVAPITAPAGAVAIGPYRAALLNSVLPH